MGHLQTLESEPWKLREELGFVTVKEEDFEKLIQWVKSQVLESYRNGLKAKAHPEGVRRDAAKNRSN